MGRDGGNGCERGSGKSFDVIGTNLAHEWPQTFDLVIAQRDENDSRICEAHRELTVLMHQMVNHGRSCSMDDLLRVDRILIHEDER